MTALFVKRLDETVRLPERKTAGAAGYDIYARDSAKIKKGEIFTFQTGLAFHIPDGYVGRILGRSSLERQGLHVLAGVIDSDYRGEIGLVFKNLTQSEIVWLRGDRIAQLLIQKIETWPVFELGELSESERSSGGFGSTGA